MSPRKWFKRILKLKKQKKDKPKQAKEQSSSAEKSDESSAEKHETRDEPSSIPNEDLIIEQQTVTTRLIEDIAATRIQNAYRSFMARKTSHRVRGAVKFEAFFQDHTDGDQTATALNYIHSWSRIQNQIRARRLSMIAEARMKQKKLENQLKLEAKIHELEVEWCGGSETMEEILSRIHHKEEAAVKRERAMAYAFSHQASYSLGKESWGWSWKERWIAARPWEVRVRVRPPMTKKLDDHHQQRTKIDMKHHNEAPLAKTDLSNGKEIGKGKENNTL
ncbi:hypothetical protein TanjilG_15187 [Lupinus angustifolius]|uniref:Uncharacterized protein n=1 Tax=Lupinus angustifolius TaxID=3871 RepID=A0A1J7HP61_LUPAN|nr:hypothetical protein TanjilG_15187 [Lupinus angustifolius]